MFTPLRSSSLLRARFALRRSLAALVAVLIPLGLTLCWWVGARGERPAPERSRPRRAQPKLPVRADTAPRNERAQLELAVREAYENCLVAALIEQGLGPARRPLFATVELERALDTDLVERNAYGELSALRQEASWLRGLDPDSDLGARSWEDVRFLLGVVHWYLDGALGAEPGARAAREAHALRPEDYDGEALRAYRGLDYGDLLGLWD